MATETWYVMEDGTAADPRDIVSDDKGILKHKDGRAVAYSEHGPRSRSVDTDEDQAKAKPKPKSREMRSEEPKLPYRTRESKTE